MGDNSVDMIPPVLDNGEPNSTMANQIVYSSKETILEGDFCTPVVPSSCETILNTKSNFTLFISEYIFLFVLNCRRLSPTRACKAVCNLIYMQVI